MKDTFKTIKRGFTLVELLAAMAITTLLVLIIVALTMKGVEFWRTAIVDIRATAKAREALNTMVADLESIQLRAGNNFEWLVAERDRDIQTASAGAMKMGPEGMEFVNASRLIFFTTALDRNPAILSNQSLQSANEDNLARKETAGDINCVGYKLEYRDMILNVPADEYSSGFPVYALFRNLVSSYRTKEDLLGSTDLYRSYARFITNETKPFSFLVENILEMTLVFEVDYRTRGGQAKAGEQGNQLAYHEVENIPIVAAGARGSNMYSQVSIFGDRIKITKQGSDVQQMAYGNIVGLSISLTVVSDEGMAIVDEVRKGRPAPDMADFIKRYTKQFCQRVSIPRPN